jgi:hypothetical protein
MNALSLRGFLIMATVVALASGAAIGVYASRGRPLESLDIALIGIGSVLIGLFVGACIYMFQLTKDIRTLRRRAEEQLLPSERILLETPGTIVHYKRGQPSKAWRTVGGKLFLTTQRLVFLAHRGQPWHYQMSFPLEEIATVEPCLILGTFTGGLKLVTIAGSKELFTFGAIRDLESDRWAAAILRARYHAKPEWGV